MSDTNWMEQCLEAVRQEALEAEAKYGPPASTHESYGVLCEEVAELLAAICGNDATEIHDEAVQVAAVALRLAMACGLSYQWSEWQHQSSEPAPPFAQRSFPWAPR